MRPAASQHARFGHAALANAGASSATPSSKRRRQASRRHMPGRSSSRPPPQPSDTSNLKSPAKGGQGARARGRARAPPGAGHGGHRPPAEPGPPPNTQREGWGKGREGNRPSTRRRPIRPCALVRPRLSTGGRGAQPRACGSRTGRLSSGRAGRARRRALKNGQKHARRGPPWGQPPNGNRRGPIGPRRPPAPRMRGGGENSPTLFAFFWARAFAKASAQTHPFTPGQGEKGIRPIGAVPGCAHCGRRAPQCLGS